MTEPHENQRSGLFAFRRAMFIAIPAGLLAGMLLALHPLLAADNAVKITIDNFTFTPPEITVPIGSTITWVNHDDIPHTVVSGDRAFRSKALDTDDSYSFTFAAAGDFKYFCGLHPHMTGKVIVTP